MQFHDATNTIEGSPNRSRTRLVRNLRDKLYPLLIASIGFLAAVGGYMTGR